MPLTDADLTSKIINAFYAVYDELGYGFLESIYGAALAIELRRRDVAFQREVPIDVFYLGQKVGHFRADVIIENRIVLEIKASKALVDEDRRQMLNYLRATNLELGFLLHFGPKPRFQRLIFENARKRSITVVART